MTNSREDEKAPERPCPLKPSCMAPPPCLPPKPVLLDQLQPVFTPPPSVTFSSIFGALSWKQIFIFSLLLHVVVLLWYLVLKLMLLMVENYIASLRSSPVFTLYMTLYMILVAALSIALALAFRYALRQQLRKELAIGKDAAQARAEVLYERVKTAAVAARDTMARISNFVRFPHAFGCVGSKVKLQGPVHVYMDLSHCNKTAGRLFNRGLDLHVSTSTKLSRYVVALKRIMNVCSNEQLASSFGLYGYLHDSKSRCINMLTPRDFHNIQTAYKEGVDENGRNMRTIIEQAYYEAVSDRRNDPVRGISSFTCQEVLLGTPFRHKDGWFTPNNAAADWEPRTATTAFVLSASGIDRLDVSALNPSCRVIMMHMRDQPVTKCNYVDKDQGCRLQHMELNFGELEWHRHIENDIEQYVTTGILGRISRTSECMDASLETKTDKK